MDITSKKEFKKRIKEWLDILFKLSLLYEDQSQCDVCKYHVKNKEYGCISERAWDIIHSSPSILNCIGFKWDKKVKIKKIKCIYCKNPYYILNIDLNQDIIKDRNWHYCKKCSNEYICNAPLDYAQDCEFLLGNCICYHYLHSSVGKLEGCPNKLEIDEMYSDQTW